MTSPALPAGAAGTWKLGDLTVNRLGFGAMRLATGTPFQPGAVSRDRAASIAVLRRAVELGVNHIDTAAFYFSPMRLANELINSALSPYPDGLVLVTKVGPTRDPAGNWAIAGEHRESAGTAESTELLNVARRHDVTAAQVSLAWTLHRAPNVLAIPGTGNLLRLEENVAAAALRLDDEDLALLDRAAA